MTAPKNTPNWEWYREQARLIDKLDRLTTATVHKTAVTWWHAMRRSIEEVPICAPGQHNPEYGEYIRRLAACFNLHPLTLTKYRRVAREVPDTGKLAELVESYGSWNLIAEARPGEDPALVRDRRHANNARFAAKRGERAKKHTALERALVEVGGSADLAEAILGAGARQQAEWLLIGYTTTTGEEDVA